MQLPPVGEVEPNPFADIPCSRCGATRLRLEWRELTTLSARPLGSYSVAGAQTKVSAVGGPQPWPYCVCDGCGAEGAGKR